MCLDSARNTASGEHNGSEEGEFNAVGLALLDAQAAEGVLFVCCLRLAGDRRRRVPGEIGGLVVSKNRKRKKGNRSWREERICICGIVCRQGW